jgi:hypothetical protein
MHVQELSKRVGQPPRTGRVLEVHGRTVSVRWDDGHHSSISGGYLIPLRDDR